MKMISGCTFGNMTVRESIEACERKIDRYSIGKDPGLLREIFSDLDEVRMVLNRAMIRASANDDKRREQIDRGLEKIKALRDRVQKI
jgi:hypothetical protein